MAEYAIIKQPSGSRVVARIIRDMKRYAEVEYPTGLIVREVRSLTTWRYPTRKEAEAIIDRMGR